MSAGLRAHLVPEVAAAVYARLAAADAPRLPPGHPDDGVDFSARLAAATATTAEAATETIDLVDSPQPAAPAKRRARAAPLGSPPKRSRALSRPPNVGVDGARASAAHASPPMSPPPAPPPLPAPKASKAPKAPKAARAAGAAAGASGSGLSPKRGAVTRTVPSKQLLQRLDRALKHPILLVDRTEDPNGSWREFHIQGSTGDIYVVRICRDPSCTCLDFQKRRKGEASGAAGPCKHILFVMHRVLKVERMDMRLYQVSLLDSEVTELFADAPAAPGSDLMADGAVVTAFRESQQDDDDESDGEDAECPICFDRMGAGERVRCSKCSGRLHASCMAQVHPQRDGARKCPLCRAAWVARDDDAGRVLNLAKHSSRHRHELSLAQLYPESHQFIGARQRGRGRGSGRGRGGGRGHGRGRGRGAGPAAG